MPSQPERRRPIQIPVAVHQKLKIEAAKRGRSMSSLASTAIAASLKFQQPEANHAQS